MRWLAVLVVLAVACNRPSGEDVRDATRDATYDTTFDTTRRPDLVIEALHLGPGAKVADVGAGTGLFTACLAEAVAPEGRVVATEVDQARLQVLHTKLERVALDDVVEERVVRPDVPGLEPGTYAKLTWDDAPEADAPSEAGTYDAILLAEVDNLLPDPVAWLRAAAPALAAGGRVGILNFVRDRDAAVAAARAAGLVLVAESRPVSTHFLAVFQKP